MYKEKHESARPLMIKLDTVNSEGSLSDTRIDIKSLFVPDEMITGRYRVVELIGRGGFGEVYKAFDVVLSRDVAIKVLFKKQGLADNIHRQNASRFLNEARITAQLKHPALPITYDFGQLVDGEFFLVCELLIGESLSRAVKQQALEPMEALKMLEQVASAVQVAHEHGILHRDLKPSNIFCVKNSVSEQVSYKVLDFGIAKGVGESSMSGILTEHTQVNSLIGSPRYLAPERLKRLPDYGPPSDIYSLGIVLYIALTQEFPYNGRSILDIGMQHLSAPIPKLALSSIPKTQEEKLQELLENMLAKEPENRIPTAVKLIEDIHKLLALFETEHESTQQTQPDIVEDLRTTTTYEVKHEQSELDDSELDHVESLAKELPQNEAYTPAVVERLSQSVSPQSKPIVAEQVNSLPIEQDLTYPTKDLFDRSTFPRAAKRTNDFSTWLLSFIALSIVLLIVGYKFFVPTLPNRPQDSSLLSMKKAAEKSTDLETNSVASKMSQTSRTNSKKEIEIPPKTSNATQATTARPLKKTSVLNEVEKSSSSQPLKQVKKSKRVKSKRLKSKRLQSRTQQNSTTSKKRLNHKKKNNKASAPAPTVSPMLPRSLKLKVYPLKATYLIGDRLSVKVEQDGGTGQIPSISVKPKSMAQLSKKQMTIKSAGKMTIKACVQSVCSEKKILVFEQPVDEF